MPRAPHMVVPAQGRDIHVFGEEHSEDAQENEWMNPGQDEDILFLIKPRS